MNAGQTVFRQLLQFLPRHEFNHCARRYRGEHRVRSLTTIDQFLCLAYAQLSGRETLRDSIINRTVVPPFFKVFVTLRKSASVGEF
jgi:hypothetical protein